MTIPLRFAIPVLIVCAWAGWAAGGLHEQRRSDMQANAASVTHNRKADLFRD